MSVAHQTAPAQGRSDRRGGGGSPSTVAAAKAYSVPGPAALTAASWNPYSPPATSAMASYSLEPALSGMSNQLLHSAAPGARVRYR